MINSPDSVSCENKENFLRVYIDAYLGRLVKAEAERCFADRFLPNFDFDTVRYIANWCLGISLRSLDKNIHPLVDEVYHHAAASVGSVASFGDISPDSARYYRLVYDRARDELSTKMAKGEFWKKLIGSESSVA